MTSQISKLTATFATLITTVMTGTGSLAITPLDIPETKQYFEEVQLEIRLPDLHYTEQSQKDRIINYFGDTPVLAEIARCESTYRHIDETTGEILRGRVDSRDVGVMQINEHYHLSTSKALGYDIYTFEGNMAYAKYLYNKKGLAPWSASKPCWSNSYSEIASK